MHVLLSEPLPSNKSDYPERLARDLAIGVFEGDWNNQFPIKGVKGFGDFYINSEIMRQDELTKYCNQIWGGKPPFERAIDMHYLVKTYFFGDNTSFYELPPASLEFARKVQVAPIFISYRRCESSAFALLLLARMAARKKTPYLDQHPDPEFPTKRLSVGVDWQPQLKAAVNSSDSIVLLIRPRTLEKTSFIHTEIGWALNSTSPKKIIPVLHNGFKRTDLAAFENHTDYRLVALIRNTQGIDVTAEDPDGYNIAIERLLIELNIRE